MRRDYASPEDFEVLVREHQGTVFRLLSRLTGPGPHLEDLAQDVFLRLYRALPEFRGDSLLSTYLYRITVNVAQGEWKRRKRERDHLAPAPGLEDEGTCEWLENQPASLSGRGGGHTLSPEQHLQQQETRAVIEAALLDLPAPERAALVLFHGEDLSYEGVAVALGLPVNTVRTHLHRGRKRLAHAVQQRLASPLHPTTCPRERKAG